MNPEEQDVHQRGDSDDEIAELRFQALLTKKENEAEVSPARSLHPYNDSNPQMSMSQPLSNYQGNHQYNYRGRGRGSQFYKPYLQTFSQQIASNSVNSNNIVVLTSSDADDEKQSFAPDWARNRRGHYGGRGGRWPRGGDRGVNNHTKNGPPMLRIEQPAPPTTVIVPEEKYSSPNPQESSDNKAKLSARMRRLQGPDSDSEDSESDSSSDSSSSDSSSDSNSSSSDSSSSGSDTDSDNSQEAKKSEKVAVKRPKGKEGGGMRTPAGAAALPEAKSDSTVESRVWTRSPNKSGCPPSKLPPPTANSEPSVAALPDLSKNVPHSPPYAKDAPSRSPSMPYSPGRRRSPLGSRYSRSPPPRRRSPISPRDIGGYPRRLKSDSRSPRRYSRSPPPPRNRTPSRRYSTPPPPRHSRRSCSPPIRSTHSPLPRGASSKLSPPSKYSPGRYRSRSPGPPRRVRAPRSPAPRRTRSPRSPILRRLPSRSPPRPRSRSPLSPPKRYSSRSPLRPRRRYGSPTPPPPHTRSPYSQRSYGAPRGRRSRSMTPPQRRYRSITPRGPWSPPARSRSPRRPVPPLSPPRRKRSYTPLRYSSRSPLARGRGHRSPIARSRSPFSPPLHPKRAVSPPPASRPSEAGARDRSPLPRKYGSPRPLSRYGSPPPLRKGGSTGESAPLKSLRPRSPSYSRQAPSPYRSRSPPPAAYYRSRHSPVGAPERSLRTQSQSPPYYGTRDVYIARGGRGAAPAAHYNDPTPKRYPMGGDQPWPSHKSEPYPHTIYRHPPPSHYPPKFPPGEEGGYGARSGHAPPPQGHPQFPPDKHWPLLGPPGRSYDSFPGGPHFGGRGGGPRFDRFPDNNPPLAGGGRGRGMRGHRGHPPRGVHSRLGNRVPWAGPHQGPSLGPHDPAQYGDPYIREKFPSQRGPHPMAPMDELEPVYMDRKPPLLLDPPKMHPASPPPTHHPQRVPRGPKTPPYSPPKRDPSPFEWQKRDRTPSLSPSPSRRYDKEEPPLQRPLTSSHRAPVRAPSRERGASLKRYGSPGPREVAGRGTSQYRKDDIALPPSSPAHTSGKKPPRGDGSQEDADDRQKGRRIDGGERHPRDPPPRKAPSSDSHKREEDRGLKRGDERRRTPPSKGTPRPKAPQNGERHEDSRGRERRSRERPEDHRKLREGRKRSREKEELDGLPPRVVREATHDGDIKRRREREREDADSRAKRDRDRGRDVKAKYEPKEDSKEVRKDEREEEAKRRVSKEELRSKDSEEGSKKRGTDSKSSKDDLDEDAKRKKKKQHKEAEKKAPKHKKEKKRKKKKKDSKKKKKSHKGSDTEELTPKRKRKSEEGVGREGNDLRHILTKKGNGSPTRRRKDSPVSYRRDEETFKRRRRADTRSSAEGKDWRSRARSRTSEREATDGLRRKDGRPHIPRERNNIDDHSGGSKGLLVTVGSGANRQVTSGSSSMKSKGGSSKDRLPVVMRLGPGNEEADQSSGSSKSPKKGSSRLSEGGSRRKGSGSISTAPRRHQSPRRLVKGPTR